MYPQFRATFIPSWKKKAEKFMIEIDTIEKQFVTDERKQITIFWGKIK